MLRAVTERTRALEQNAGRRGATPNSPAKPARKRTRKATTGDDSATEPS